MPESFTFHEDAGHGWLEVPYSALTELKIENQITGFSYRDGDTVFLEEDQDAFTFVKAYLAFHGKTAFQDFPSKNVYDGNHSYIRNYKRYK